MSFMQLLGGLGSAAAGLNTADAISQLGAQGSQSMMDLGEQLQQQSQFTGYGTTTGLGTGTVDAQGNTNIGVGPDAAMQGLSGTLAGMTQNSFQNAQGMMGQGYDQMANAFANIPGREQEIYGRAMAMQQPGLDAQRASQQAREYAMGRGGVRGSQFGGTAEDAATARAQAQAQNAASFQAMNQAQQEAMNLANVGNQMVGAGGQMGQFGQGMAGVGQNYYQQSYLPMEMQMQAMGLGGQNADRFQSGQFTGNNLLAQLGLGGLQSQINAGKTAAELEGNIYTGAMDALGGFASTSTGQAIDKGIASGIDGLFEWLKGI